MCGEGAVEQVSLLFVFSATGGMGKAATVMYQRLASLLLVKGTTVLKDNELAQVPA